MTTAATNGPEPKIELHRGMQRECNEKIVDRGRVSDIAHKALGVLTFPGLLNSNYRNWTMSGKTTEMEYKDLGPMSMRFKKDKQSLLDYVNQKEVRGNIMQANGHHYLVLTEYSGAIIIPNGDYDPATSKIMWVHRFDRDSGEGSHETDKLHRSFRSLILTMDHVLGLMGKGKKIKSVVIDYQLGTFKAYEVDTKNLKTHRETPYDITVDISKLKNEIDAIWDKRKTDSKHQLDGDPVNRPFAGKKKKGKKIAASNNNNNSIPSSSTSQKGKQKAVQQGPTISDVD